jgi:nucleoside-diphosphate-sugar epimerase
MAARVLLFGGSGFIGRPLGAALEGDPRVGSVIRVGRQTRTEKNWVRHDLLSDAEQLARLIRHIRPDVVINSTGRLAGCVSQLAEANVLVTARLLDAVAAEAPAARVVVLGSAAEYGVVPVGQPVAEDSPTNPVSGYGVTKLASTQLVQVAAGEGRVDAVALRVFNPIGPGIPAENLLGRAAACLRAAMASGADHIRLGPLGAYRDFVDVRDVAAAITAAALADKVKEPVLNVGSGVAVTARRAIEILADAAGFTGQVLESAPAPSRSRDVGWIAADLGRISSTLGWTPTHDLRDSVRAGWAHS